MTLVLYSLFLNFHPLGIEDTVLSLYEKSYGFTLLFDSCIHAFNKFATLVLVSNMYLLDLGWLNVAWQ